MQSTPTKETDAHDVRAIEKLLAAHAEKAPPLAHDPAAASVAPPVQVAPPISVGVPISQVEPSFRGPDARDMPVETARPSEITLDASRLPGAQPTSKWAKRATLAALALLGATTAAAWQQYGDQAKAMAAEWTPPFVLAALPSVIKPNAAAQPGTPAATASAGDQAPLPQQPVAEPVPEQPAPATIAAAPPVAESSQLQAMAQDLATMGQQVEELKATIAQLKASQAQMTRELAKAMETRAVEAKAAETRPVEQSPKPKVSALTPPNPRPAAQPPARKPKPVAAYSPAYVPPPPVAPPPPPQAAAPLPPAPPAQTLADDGQPVVRPPMPVR